MTLANGVNTEDFESNYSCSEMDFDELDDEEISDMENNRSGTR